MNLAKSLSIVLVGILLSSLWAQNSEKWNDIIGSAYTGNQSYRLLEKLCDEAGGRLVGSTANEKAMQILVDELQKVGFQPREEKFRIPGWVRGDDEIIMTAPATRRIHGIALGYVDAKPAFEAEAVFAENGFDEDFQKIDASGKIVVVTSEKPKAGKPLLRQEAIAIAAKHSAKAILFINSKPGTLRLAGTGDFQGVTTPIPAFSISYEEGKWLQRLLDEGQDVKMQMTVRSYCKEIETANLVLTIPGEVRTKIVIGAHFDSWDLSQGAIDNGLGTAILFDVARLMKTYSPHNNYTLEFVWFNGEELGLWGSKKYIEMHAADDIAAMVNMDMTGSPTGFNPMGSDEFVPFLEKLVSGLNGFDLSDGVKSRPWTNSDNQPFMLHGIPTFGLMAHLDEESVKYYHSAGDSFDKVNKKYLSDAAAVVSVLVYELANNRELQFHRKSEDEVVEMLKTFHLDDRLKRQKEWPFGNR